MNTNLERKIYIDYTNYKGIFGTRAVIPEQFYFDDAPPWHMEKQWLMKAWDCDKGEYRTFAMKAISHWDTV